MAQLFYYWRWKQMVAILFLSAVYQEFAYMATEYV